jgi:ribonuclease Z
VTMGPDPKRQKTEAVFAAGPAEFNVQVFSGAVLDSAPVVVVSTAAEKYLVNAPAGVQRVFAQHKVRTTKLSRVLLTHLNMDTVGGLPGLVMTMADGG